MHVILMALPPHVDKQIGCCSFCSMFPNESAHIFFMSLYSPVEINSLRFLINRRRLNIMAGAYNSNASDENVTERKTGSQINFSWEHIMLELFHFSDSSLYTFRDERSLK